MSLWVFGHKRYNKNVCMFCEELVTTNGYLRIVKIFKVNSEVGFEIVIPKVF